ncbi:MAG: antibiotic biosynthesis monooxygenase [Bacteroidia bacterium]
MITRIVRLTINPSRFHEFAKVYAEAQKTIITFKGCMELQVYTDVQQTNVVFTISKWNNESDLNHYRFSAFFKNVWTTVKPMFSAKAEAWSLTEFGEG